MRPARTAPLLAALALLVAGCGDDSSTGSSGSSGSGHNDADVAFATGMIPHHAQALDMVEMAEDRELDSEVSELVEDIRAAQEPEIETMTGWLEDWDEEVPSTDGSMEGMDHGSDHGSMDGGSGMVGMMSEEDMAELEGASDAMFQQMWLEMMVEHHRGAVEMAQTEQAEGEFPDAVELAKDIEESQSAEIATMEELLGQS